MTNVTGGREHIIRETISVPADGYVDNLRDLLAFYEARGPENKRFDDSATLRVDEERISLVWEVSREPMPQFSELENFLRFVAGVWSGQYNSEFEEDAKAEPIDPKVLDRHIKVYRDLVAQNRIKPL